jgi:hypothetical protein
VHADPFPAGGWQTGNGGSAKQADYDIEDDEPGELRDWEDATAWFARGGYASWTAVFGDRFGSGLGLQGGLAYGLTSNLVIRGTTGFYNFGSDDIHYRYVYQPHEIPGVVDSVEARVADASVTAIPVLFGVDYVFASSGKLRPFIGGAVGADFLMADFNAQDASIFEYNDLFQAYLGIQLRAGATLLRPDANLGIEFGGSYNMIWDELPEFKMGDPSHHDFYEIGVGVIYFLPEF